MRKVWQKKSHCFCKFGNFPSQFFQVNASLRHFRLDFHHYFWCHQQFVAFEDDHMEDTLSVNFFSDPFSHIKFPFKWTASAFLRFWFWLYCGCCDEAKSRGCDSNCL
jgi:hypothetical protein